MLVCWSDTNQYIELGSASSISGVDPYCTGSVTLLYLIYHNLMNLTKEELGKLPVKNHFRMRGESMTRLEVFSDAAFAFALSMLVVSIGEIPNSYQELLSVLRETPAFALSFAQIAVFWIAHRSWSRRYGLENSGAIILTLLMIFVILIFVYPLQMLYSSGVQWLMGSQESQSIEAFNIEEVSGLFVIYGIGYTAMTGIIMMLFAWSLKCKQQLNLNNIELLHTRLNIAVWGTLASVGVFSVLFAMLVPSSMVPYSGFVYVLQGPIMPLVTRKYRHQEKRIMESGSLNS